MLTLYVADIDSESCAIRNLINEFSSVAPDATSTTSFSPIDLSGLHAFFEPSLPHDPFPSHDDMEQWDRSCEYVNSAIQLGMLDASTQTSGNILENDTAISSDNTQDMNPKPKAKLTAKDARFIFSCKNHKGERGRSASLAKCFGVTKKAIHDIWIGRTWRAATVPFSFNFQSHFSKPSQCSEKNQLHPIVTNSKESTHFSDADVACGISIKNSTIYHSHQIQNADFKSPQPNLIALSPPNLARVWSTDDLSAEVLDFLQSFE